MQSRRLGKSELHVSALGLGCMGMSEFYEPLTESDALRTIQYAIERGVTFLDTADMYGSGANEVLVGQAIRPIRNRIQLSSKCGIVRTEKGTRRNGRADYIQWACETSLKRLGTDYIDVYYLHRVDPNTPVEESVLALADLVKQGKIGHVGLSKVDKTTLRRANAVYPITAVQMEFSLWAPLAEDFVEECRKLDIAIVAYSPLCKGLLAETMIRTNVAEAHKWRREDPRFQAAGFQLGLEPLTALRRLALKTRSTPAQLALAWLLQRKVIPIPGMRRKAHVQENLNALDLTLSLGILAELRAISTAYTATQQTHLEESQYVLA